MYPCECLFGWIWYLNFEFNTDILVSIFRNFTSQGNWWPFLSRCINFKMLDCFRKDMISAFYHINGHSRPLFLMLFFQHLKIQIFTIFGLCISWHHLDFWSIYGDFPLVSPFFCLTKILHSPTILFRALEPPNLQISSSKQPKP